MGVINNEKPKHRVPHIQSLRKKERTQEKPFQAWVQANGWMNFELNNLHKKTMKRKNIFPHW